MEQPNYLDYCTDDIEELYSKLQDSVLKTVVKRIIKYGEVTPSAWNDIKILQESGMVYDDVLDIVSEFTQLSQSAVQEMFTAAKVENIKYDNEIYKAAGMQPLKENGSPAVNQIVRGAISKTNGNLKNLTMTTAGAAQDKFIDACSIAEMEINTGAYDVNTAIRHAVEYAIQDGANVYYYNDEEDGTIVTAKRNIVSAVRTAVLTGVSQTTGEISLENAKKMGTDLMELSAHIGARPSHSVWQGKIVCFSRRKTKYLTLADIGYGEIDGFKGINCRHYWFPFIEGVSTRTYTDEQLEEMNNATVNYNGNEIPLYKATQKQRAMERQIRFERSQLVSYDTAIKEAKQNGNTELAADLQINFDNIATKLKAHESMYKEYCNQTGLPVLSERLQYPAFNRSVSQKAVQSAKRHFEEWKSYLPEDVAPKNLANYYKIKYNNPEQYKTIQAIYKQEKQREYIRNNCVLDVLEGRQGKHIKADSNYIEGRSYLTISLEEIQALVKKYAGTGKCEFYRSGQWSNTEIIGKTERPIGFVINPETLEETATSAFKIHYSKKGIHIVPCREDGDE